MNMRYRSPVMNIFKLITGLVFLFFSYNLDAQNVSKVDTLFIKDYSDQLNLALYSKVKYADFKLTDDITDKNLKYSPNRQINLGLYYH